MSLLVFRAETPSDILDQLRAESYRMRIPNKQWTIDRITGTKESFICRRVHNYGSEVPHGVKQVRVNQGTSYRGWVHLM